MADDLHVIQCHAIHFWKQTIGRLHRCQVSFFRNGTETQSNDLFARDFAELIHRTVADNPIPGIDDIANVVVWHGVDQCTEGFDVVDEGELFAFQQLSTGTEANSEFDFALSQDVSDLSQTVALDVEELVERQTIRCRGNANQRTFGTQLLSDFAEWVKLSNGCGESVIVRVQIDCQLERADLDFRRLQILRGVVKRSPLRTTKHVVHVDVHATEGVGQGQFDQLALTTVDAERGRTEVFKHGDSLIDLLGLFWMVLRLGQ